MQFSDTSNKSGIIQMCEVLTGLGDTGISGNTTTLRQFTSLINQALHKVLTMIIQAQDDWDFDDANYTTNYPIATTNLVANQQDYQLATSLNFLRINRVEITYDGTNWNRAVPIDIQEIGLATDTTSINGRFSTTKPYYDITANALFLYPIPTTAVTNGLKIWFTRDVNEFTAAGTDTTATPGFDKPLHPILAYEASFEFCMANDQVRANILKNQVDEWEARLKQYYGSRQNDRQYVLKPAFIRYE